MNNYSMPTGILQELQAIEKAVRDVRRDIGNIQQPLSRASAHCSSNSGIELLAKARSIYVGRRTRDEIFGGMNLFAEPAWDILLDLFVAYGDKRNISISSSAIAAAVPPTTSLRWITRLVDDGLIARAADPKDRRREFLHLTEAGLSLVAEAVAKS